MLKDQLVLFCLNHFILFKNLSEHENVNLDCWSNCDAESSDNDDVLEDLKDEYIDIQVALKEWVGADI